jgi:hypothetical protein
MRSNSLRHQLRLVVLLTVMLGGSAVQAQGPVPVQPEPSPVVPVPVDGPRLAAQRTAPAPLTPLRLIVAIQRYEGEKQISSHPYTLWVNANDGQTTRLTAGQQVPIPMTVFQGGGGAAASGPPTRSVNYQNIGTSISANATQADDGRFRITLVVDDSSVVPAKDPDGFVTLKSLKTGNLLLLTDGQRADFLAATDKVTGEVTRIVVTVTVLK